MTTPRLDAVADLGVPVVRASCPVDAIDAELCRHGVRGCNSVVTNIRELLEERRTLRWRLAEVQKILDEASEGDGGTIRVSRQRLHFAVTGRLPYAD